MPYIKTTRRSALDPDIDELAGTLEAMNSKRGDLNYTISRLILAYVQAKGGPSYDTLCDVTGVLNDVKTEFERRVVAPYEDQKIIENGDLPGLNSRR